MYYDYVSFGSPEKGKVVSEDKDSVIVYAGNPYGGENLVLVNLYTDDAFAHGNCAVLSFARQYMKKKAYMRAIRFLINHGVQVNSWVFVERND